MEEKVLIVGNKKKKTLISWITPGLVLLLIGFILMELATVVFSRSSAFHNEWEVTGFLSEVFYVLGAIVSTVGVAYWWVWGKCQLTVTTKRVYGVTAFGKRVDLPIDSISAVGTSSFNGVSVTTSSGAIKFVLLTNNAEIHRVVSTLLINRQSKTVSGIPVDWTSSRSNADELKKYKDLWDNGVITQEEFDKKKQQLLEEKV